MNVYSLKLIKKVGYAIINIIDFEFIYPILFSLRLKCYAFYTIYACLSYINTECVYYFEIIAKWFANVATWRPSFVCMSSIRCGLGTRHTTIVANNHKKSVYQELWWLILNHQVSFVLLRKWTNFYKNPKYILLRFCCTINKRYIGTEFIFFYLHSTIVVFLNFVSSSWKNNIVCLCDNSLLQYHRLINCI